MSSRIIDIAIAFSVGSACVVVMVLLMLETSVYIPKKKVDPALMQSLYRECIQQVAASPIACKDAAIKIAERSAAQ